MGDFARRDVLRLGAVAVAMPSASALLSGTSSAQGASTRRIPERGPGLRSELPSDGRTTQPFALDQVNLGSGIFKEKRDRILHYLREYGPTMRDGVRDELHGPDRMLRSFRVNAGLDDHGVEPIGSWESAEGNLRGHYTGHFLTALVQAYADTGETIFKEKLDYMVSALKQCQDALADAANQPSPRIAGRFGSALRLTGTPDGHITGDAGHVRLPEGIVDGIDEFTVATWINLGAHDEEARIFDFGRPGDASAGHTTSMYLAAHASGGPRYGITNAAPEGERRIEAGSALPTGWTHVAVTLSDGIGTLYVDGSVAGINETMDLSPADLGTTTTNWLGRALFPQLDTKYLNASLDEFQIYSRALNAEEIEHLQTTPEVSVEDLRAWYRFDETEGPAVVDSSGRGNDAELMAHTDGRRHPGFLSAYTEAQFIRVEEFCSYSDDGIWAPYYTLHKIMMGLLDAYDVTGNEEALQIVRRMGDWVHSRLTAVPRESLDRMWTMHIAGEYGGMNEVMAHLAALAEEDAEAEQYLEAALCFDNRAQLFSAIVDRVDVLTGIHANTHVPQFTGYLRVFEQAPDHYEEHLTAAENFWDMVVPGREFSHGGTGGQYAAGDDWSENTNAELFQPPDDVAGCLEYQRRSETDPESGGAETCTTYNALKLARNLFFHNPDPRYMDYYERGLINHILGSRRDADSASDPQVTYFLPAHPGARRGFGNLATCCGGTGMENHTKYQESIYFRSVDGETLYVNLYISSVLTWGEKGLTITQETDYPRTQGSKITFTGDGELELRLRVPGWVTKGYAVAVNGVNQNIDAAPGAYVNLRRSWSSGDVVEISTPFSLRIEGTTDDPSVQSVFHGPVVLGLLEESRSWQELSFYRHLKLDGDLSRAISSTETPNVFELDGHLLRPLYVGLDMPHHLYFKRFEPTVVFGSMDSGVSNEARDDDSQSFLDRVWEQAPFSDHAQFLRHVKHVSAEWQRAGRFTAREVRSILIAARKAKDELTP